MTLVFDETDLGDDFRDDLGDGLGVDLGDGLGVDLGVDRGVDDLDLGDADNILFIQFPFSPTLFFTGITPDITSFTGDSFTSSSDPRAPRAKNGGSPRPSSGCHRAGKKPKLVLEHSNDPPV